MCMSVCCLGYRGRRGDCSLLQRVCQPGRRRGSGQQSLERTEEAHWIPDVASQAHWGNKTPDLQIRIDSLSFYHSGGHGWPATVVVFIPPPYFLLVKSKSFLRAAAFSVYIFTVYYFFFYAVHITIFICKQKCQFGKVCIIPIMILNSVSLSLSVFSITEETPVTVTQQTSLQIYWPEVLGQEQNSAQYLSTSKQAKHCKIFICIYPHCFNLTQVVLKVFCRLSQTYCTEVYMCLLGYISQGRYYKIRFIKENKNLREPRISVYIYKLQFPV